VDEYTLVKTVPGLPQMWVWHPDANVVALHPCVDTAEKRSEALAQVYAHWRRSCIQLVPDPDSEPEIERTQPIHVPCGGRVGHPVPRGVLPEAAVGEAQLRGADAQRQAEVVH
jgi:hypothetical protein